MKRAPQKYRATNWKADNKALKARGSLLIWLDPKMSWHGQASGKRGRSQICSDQAIQFCLSIKCLFNSPLRQAMVMTQSLLSLAGLDWPVPDYSTVSRRQKTLQVVVQTMPTTTGLHLLVDSTGIKMLGERIIARDFDRQVAELQVRAAVLNRFTRLGTPVTVPLL
jgi:hypothetical protein